jgi:hypothetical protein
MSIAAHTSTDNGRFLALAGVEGHPLALDYGYLAFGYRQRVTAFPEPDPILVDGVVSVQLHKNRDVSNRRLITGLLDRGRCVGVANGVPVVTPGCAHDSCQSSLRQSRPCSNDSYIPPIVVDATGFRPIPGRVGFESRGELPIGCCSPGIRSRRVRLGQGEGECLALSPHTNGAGRRVWSAPRLFQL